jgi:hypothetical protein
MQILNIFPTGMTVRYEPGDRIVLLRDHCIGDKQIGAGESGIVVRLVSSGDRRLANSLYIDIQLDSGAEQISTLQVGHRSNLSQITKVQIRSGRFVGDSGRSLTRKV